MIPKGGVTTNEPLAERPPVPKIPQAIAPGIALLEEIAFGDLDPVQQPAAPTSHLDARREAVATPTIPILPHPLEDVPEVPLATTERNRNKIIASPKAEINIIRSPPEKASASPSSFSDNEARPHSINCPHRRVKCVPCDLIVEQHQLNNHACISNKPVGIEGSFVPVDVVSRKDKRDCWCVSREAKDREHNNPYKQQC